MKFKLSPFILFLILLYPITYIAPSIKEIGPKWVNYYFSLFLCVVFFADLFSKKRILIDKIIKSTLFVILFMLIVVILQTDSLRYTKPLFFFFYLLAIIILFPNKLDSRKIKKTFYVLTVIYLIVISITLFFNNLFQTPDSRFFGYSFSPTTFSVFITAFFIVAIGLFNNNFLKIFLYVLILSLIILSKTRLNILLFLTIPLLSFIGSNSNKRALIIFSSGILLIFLYPIYDYVKDTTNSAIIESRISSNNIDYSLETRLSLYNVLGNEFKNITPIELLFGKGAEYSRREVAYKFDFDIFPHNDYFRIIIDFGVIFFLSFLYLLTILGRRSKVSFLLVLLYLITFYHNMIYDLFIISVITYFGKPYEIKNVV